MYSYPNFPDHVYVELTNICNARCTICATPQMKRPRNIMPFSLFQQIVDECSQYRDTKILPFLHGESLLIPNALDYFRYIRKVAPLNHLNLTSNGSRLTMELTEQILEEDLIDSFIFPSMEEIRKRLKKFGSILVTMKCGVISCTLFVDVTNWVRNYPRFPFQW